MDSMKPNKDSIDFGKKLSQLRTDKGLSQAEVAKFLGMAQTTYAGYENGNRSVTVTLIQKFSTFFKVHPDYLLGVQEKSSILPYYESLSESRRRIADATIKALWEEQQSEQQLTSTEQAIGSNIISFHSSKRQERHHSPIPQQGEDSNIIQFRLSEQPASAGYGYSLDPENFSIIHIRNDGSIDPDTMFGVPILGDSMEPDYHDGDIAVIKQDVDVEFGGIGLFTVGNRGYLKKRAPGKLLSLNSKYPPIPTPDDEYFACNGKVIGILNSEYIISE